MIEAILSFLGGAGLRAVMEWMKLRDAANQRTHEKEMFDLQLQADKLRSELRVQEAEVAGEIQKSLAEIGAMIEAAKAQAVQFATTGNPWLDSLLVVAEVASALVRPVLAYFYCIFAYGAYKLAVFWMVFSQGVPLASAVTTVWTPQDYAVMTSIIGFWFVDRQLRKAGK